ncbi:HK97-gp10 family putative phage morphogenesis protein [Sphingomonas sp. GM_Shp_2]|uniref:HK97-gp10 family putative phage morphogenesis protein n=1 Tax=Sphingomonas sp. GM_Shp_2 TaxID=2937380 RepID=UPI002269A8F2|nr:HK97-gp10 family putative phage morphogenesis protein [Sphingomonas sp. GM_Shp_2]
MKVKVTSTGTKDIARRLDAMSKALQRKTIIPVLIKNTRPIADDMRDKAPRRSGQLANSVAVSTRLSPHQATVNEPIAQFEVYVGPGPLPQAIQEEFGNDHQPAEPFIRPAYDAGVDRALRGIAEDGIAAILAAGKKG